MSQAIIQPGGLQGNLPAIPSKSQAHRLLICAALADAATKIRMQSPSQDIQATLNCIQRLGARVVPTQEGVTIHPIGTPTSSPLLDCGESGTTLRLLLPVVTALCAQATFHGHGRLPQRPIGELQNCLEAHGACFDKQKLPFQVRRGDFTGGVFCIPGDISSQYLSGLLLMLPLLPQGGEIRLTTPLASQGYVDMTLAAMAAFGVKVQKQPGRYLVSGGQAYRSPGTAGVEGDWSNAAFFLAAGALSGPVTVTGLSMSSLQRDKDMLELLLRFGANVILGKDSVTVQAGAPRRGMEIDVENIPDLAPVLCVMAAAARGGKTTLLHTARLRLKESDRVEAILNMLHALGVRAEAGPDRMVVYGGGQIAGGVVDCCGDHRIAMAAAVGACVASGKITVLNARAVDKSYPAFFEDFARLGGNVYVV